MADVRTFEQFFSDEYATIVALCAWLTGDRATGEDLAQDAFGAVHRRWPEIARLERPGAYARRVAINMSSNERRRRGRERLALRRIGRAPETVVQLGDGGEHGDGRAPLWSEVAALPVQQRAAIGLRYLEDLSTEEIAAVLDCSAATVRVHLHRAHRQLAERLGRTAEHDEEDAR